MNECREKVRIYVGSLRQKKKNSLKKTCFACCVCVIDDKLKSLMSNEFISDKLSPELCSISINRVTFIQPRQDQGCPCFSAYCWNCFFLTHDKFRANAHASFGTDKWEERSSWLNRLETTACWKRFQWQLHYCSPLSFPAGLVTAIPCMSMSQCAASVSLFHTLTKIESELWEAQHGG